MAGGRKQRVSLVTLGVADVERAREFYAAWGWQPAQRDDAIVFYQGNGLVIALFERAAMAADRGGSVDELGVGGMALSQNFATEAEVDERFRSALAAGGIMIKRPERTDWGGYSGYIADLDGHVWELAVNPFWDLEIDGSTTIPDVPEGA